MAKGEYHIDIPIGNYQVNAIKEGYVPKIYSDVNVLEGQVTQQNFELIAVPPVSFWRFDEGTGILVADDSIYHNDGTIHGNGVWIAGRIGKALLFNGINSYVEIPPFSLSSPTKSLTFLFWVNSLFMFNINQTLIGEGYQSKSEGYIWIARKANSDTLLFQYADTVELDGTSAYSENFFSGFDNTFIFIAITCDYEEKKIGFYRNGVLINEVPMSNTPQFPSTNRTKYIGAYKPTIALFRGILDEVRIFNYLLPAEKIETIYDNEKRKTRIVKFSSYPAGATVTTTKK